AYADGRPQIAYLAGGMGEPFQSYHVAVQFLPHPVETCGKIRGGTRGTELGEAYGALFTEECVQEQPLGGQECFVDRSVQSDQAPVHGRETFVRQLLQPDVAANGQVQDGGGEVCDVDAFVDERADLSGLHVVGRMETQAVLVLPERGVVALYGFLAQSSFVSAAYSDAGDQTTDEHAEQDSEDARGGRGDGKRRGQRPALGEQVSALRRSLGVGDGDVEPVRGGHVGLEEVCHRGVRSHVGACAVHGAAWFTGQAGQCLRGQVGGDGHIGVRDFVAVGANGSPFHLNTLGDLADGPSDPVVEYDV